MGLGSSSVRLDIEAIRNRSVLAGVKPADPCRVADVAYLLGVNRSTVDGWNARGVLPTPDGRFPGSLTPWWYWRSLVDWTARRIEAELELEL